MIIRTRVRFLSFLMDEIDSYHNVVCRYDAMSGAIYVWLSDVTDKGAVNKAIKTCY